LTRINHQATNLPEELNDFIRFGVTSVVGVLLPVIYVNICYAADQEFKFALVKDVDQIWRDELMETSNECVKLLLHTLLDTPFGNKAEIMLVIVPSDNIEN